MKGHWKWGGSALYSLNSRQGAQKAGFLGKQQSLVPEFNIQKKQ
jgi:hypothetical protein